MWYALKQRVGYVHNIRISALCSYAFGVHYPDQLRLYDITIINDVYTIMVYIHRIFWLLVCVPNNAEKEMHFYDR